MPEKNNDELIKWGVFGALSTAAAISVTTDHHNLEKQGSPKNTEKNQQEVSVDQKFITRTEQLDVVKGPMGVTKDGEMEKIELGE